MRSLTRTIVVTSALLFLPAPSSFAQAAVDPSGHWEGTVDVPNTPVQVGFDIAKNGKGELAGTFSQPAQHIKALPLAGVTVEGRTVRLVLKAGAASSTFAGTLSQDGKTIAGNWSQGEQTFPFSVTRTGDAQIAAPPKNAPIGKELEGTWNGAMTVAANGQQMRIVLTMANQPDGTATGTIMSPDGSGMEIPIAMSQKDKTFTFDVPSVGASFAGTLSADGSELAGTWTQGGTPLPLTFKKRQ